MPRAIRGHGQQPIHECTLHTAQPRIRNRDIGCVTASTGISRSQDARGKHPVDTSNNIDSTSTSKGELDSALLRLYSWLQSHLDGRMFEYGPRTGFGRVDCG